MSRVLGTVRRIDEWRCEKTIDKQAKVASCMEEQA